MKYNIKQLADLAGISSRTLRYYDNIGLLRPMSINPSGYRIYEEEQVNRLQRILFYKELGFDLKSIQKIMDSSDLDYVQSLYQHLNSLEKERERLNLLIENVRNTIRREEGEYHMTDAEKFHGFKKTIVEDNEKKYGQEARKKYGDESLDKSNEKLMSMTQKEYEDWQRIGKEVQMEIQKAVQEGKKPNSETGQHIAKKHKKWLLYTWDSYSKESHLGLVTMYVNDERFKSYYDEQVDGCAEFLKEAVTAYLQ